MTERRVRTLEVLPDRNQSTWQLSVIQLSGWTSLPILATSLIVLQENSLWGAILTIIVGNALLWFLRLGIILMSHRKRESTLDISRVYLGNFGSYFIAALLLISTLGWFIAQTATASEVLAQLVSLKENPQIDQFSQISVLIGIISTFLCIDGIILLRRVATLLFPILMIAFLGIIIAAPVHWPGGGELTLSLSGLSLVLGTNLGLTADLPTFFRHSKSLATSIKALTLVQLVSLALGLCSLYFGSILDKNFLINHDLQTASLGHLLKISLTLFVFLSVICANVANVYSASVGWELVAPSSLVGRKEYMILGLGLTTLFIMIANIFSVNFLLNTSDSALVNLALVLIWGYLMRRKENRFPNAYEQIAYFCAWLLSSLANGLQFAGLIPLTISPLLLGIAVIFVVLCISRLERNLLDKVKKS